MKAGAAEHGLRVAEGAREGLPAPEEGVGESVGERGKEGLGEVVHVAVGLRGAVRLGGGVVETKALEQCVGEVLG